MHDVCGDVRDGRTDDGGERVRKMPTIGANNSKLVCRGFGEVERERRSRCTAVLAGLVCGISGQADRLGESHACGYNGY